MKKSRFARAERPQRTKKCYAHYIGSLHFILSMLHHDPLHTSLTFSGGEGLWAQSAKRFTIFFPNFNRTITNYVCLLFMSNKQQWPYNKNDDLHTKIKSENQEKKIGIKIVFWWRIYRRRPWWCQIWMHYHKIHVIIGRVSRLLDDEHWEAEQVQV